MDCLNVGKFERFQKLNKKNRVVFFAEVLVVMSTFNLKKNQFFRFYFCNQDFEINKVVVK